MRGTARAPCRACFPSTVPRRKEPSWTSRTFIQSAVSQSVEGMVAAQAAAATHGATLNPAVERLQARAIRRSTGQVAGGTRVSNIAFDVAVTAVESAGAEGGSQLRVAGAGADMHAKGEQGHPTAVLAADRPSPGASAAPDGNRARLRVPADGRERRQHLVAGALIAGARDEQPPISPFGWGP